MDMSFGTEREYLDSINSLVTVASSFLDTLRAEDIKYLSAGSKSRIDKMIVLVGQAELKSVADIKPDLELLDTELGTLARKFQIIRNSYRGDSTLEDFLGKFSTDPASSYKKLQSFIDGSLTQVDTVVTTYSKIDRAKSSSKTWITTILSHQSGPKATKKPAVQTK